MSAATARKVRTVPRALDATRRQWAHAVASAEPPTVAVVLWVTRFVVVGPGHAENDPFPLREVVCPDPFSFR
ncbi:hypothetical protein OUZ56_030748 [Daphnia magna]|uniref:Uncharacterized protein n=1 Tax=Daphnia magna TaxID=35525 RepID=A0ABQ9ZSR9_9CRUS|nr:hypothetical protein OUZ56_030748 [Daphnia magna]